MAMAAEATEDLGEGAEGAPAAKRFAGKKLILFIVLPLLLLIGGAAGVFFSGILGGGSAKKDDAAQHEEAAPKPAAKQTVFFDLPDIVVNLNATNRRTNFLKISVSL